MKKLAELSVLGALSLATSLALVACGGGEGSVAEGTSATASAGNPVTDASGLAGVAGVAGVASTSPTSVLPSSTASAPAGSTAVDAAGAQPASVAAPIAAGPVANTPSIAAANSTAAPDNSVIFVEPTQLTVPEYLARRNTGVITATDPFPDAAAMAALAAANRKLAVAQLAADMAINSNYSSFAINAVVVPPLTYALLRDLTAASSGDTLTQIKNSGFDTAPVQYVATLQTSRVTHQLWADRGRRFRTGFFQSTDTLGPWPRLKAWQAAETDFASGSFTTDFALTKGLAAASDKLSPANLPGPTRNIRAVVANSVSEQANWGAVTPFEGVFDRGITKHDLVRLPLLRVTAGVKRFAGADFTADVLPMADGLQLMTLRPQVGKLQDFSKTRLEAALAEAVQGLLGSGATPAAGEMMLPKVDIDLPMDSKAALSRAGITLPFDEVNANFRSLDGLGGIYAVPAFSGASLKVGNDGLTLKAADAMAFTFSPSNVFGPTFSSGSQIPGFSSLTFDLFTCLWPKADMRSFFMVILDSRGWVVSIAAIEAPPGTTVQPVRASFNPWIGVPEMVVNGDLTGTYPLIVIAASGQTVVDVIGQSSQFGFVPKDLVTYSHQTCAQ